MGAAICTELMKTHQVLTWYVEYCTEQVVGLLCNEFGTHHRISATRQIPSAIESMIAVISATDISFKVDFLNNTNSPVIQKRNGRLTCSNILH